MFDRKLRFLSNVKGRTMDRGEHSARRTVSCCLPWLSARQDGGQPCTLRREARRQSTDQLQSASTMSWPNRPINGPYGDLTRLLRHRLHLRAQLGTTSSVAARWCRAGDHPYAFISISMLPLFENRGNLNFSTTRCCGLDAVACRTHGRLCSPRKGSPLRSDPASRGWPRQRLRASSLAAIKNTYGEVPSPTRRAC